MFECVQAAWHHSPAGFFRQRMLCGFPLCLQQRIRRGFFCGLVYFDLSCTHTCVHFPQSLLFSSPVAY